MPRTYLLAPRGGRRTCFALAALLVASSLAPLPRIGAQTTSLHTSPPLVTGAPASVGMSDERLARIDALVEGAIRDNRIPGAVALVARHGVIVHLKAYGSADATAGRPMTTDSIFRIASQTKAITSTAIMMLWEEGRLQLDDPVSKWIPEFKDAAVLKTYDEATGTYTTEPANKPITIRHLLTHTSGLGYGVIDSDPRIKAIYAKAGVTDLFTTEKITIAESVRKLAKLPLHHQPGEKFTYSEGLDVAGYLIELISGQPFDVFLRDRIFAPLGMKDTGFYLPEDKAGRLVAVHKLEGGRWARYPVTFYDPDYPIKGAKTFFSGGAGLCSTVRDYALFLQMYLNGGELNGVRILSRTTIATITADQTHGIWGGPEKHHGLAFAVVAPGGVAKGGLGSPGTFEWGGYFNTQYFADPKEGTIGLLFKQTQGVADDPTGVPFRMMVSAAIDD